jgi:hypothetical protein
MATNEGTTCLIKVKCNHRLLARISPADWETKQENAQHLRFSRGSVVGWGRMVAGFDSRSVNRVFQMTSQHLSFFTCYDKHTSSSCTPSTSKREHMKQTLREYEGVSSNTNFLQFIHRGCPWLNLYSGVGRGRRNAMWLISLYNFCSVHF